MRDQGVAVLLVSAELDEIMALSDRIAVMYRGQIVATMAADKATRERAGLADGGGEQRGACRSTQPGAWLILQKTRDPAEKFAGSFSSLSVIQPHVWQLSELASD